MSVHRISPLLAALTILAPYSAAQTPPAVTTLYTFTGQNGDGASPNGGVVPGPKGALYGTTEFGGSSAACLTNGCGTVFALEPSGPGGGTWIESILHNFTSSDGATPDAGVVIGQGGVLYGTTYAGGAYGCYDCGTVFELVPPAAALATPGGTWTEDVLHSFGGPGDASGPQTGLVVGGNGALYGTTLGPGGGTVFELRPPSASGGAWTEIILHTFTSGHGDGVTPSGTIALGANRALYGATLVGGAYGQGTVFELSPPATRAGPWKETVLYSFTGGGDGANPYAGVVLGAHGAIYGTTQEGGGTGNGVVFELTPPAAPGGAWTESVLYNFCSAFDCSDGYVPYASLLFAQGTLYGDTYMGGASNEGALFELQPPPVPGEAWTYTVLYSFTLVHGAFPSGPLFMDKDGEIYGTTFSGWDGPGTVFKLTP
ncbi:MAG: choice-of-anchor tandem repeat GloVer-containing protein [Bryobacteraceae bacterium]|jgi:uncharacterized repeat protein (TIGR03803 family)